MTATQPKPTHAEASAAVEPKLRPPEPPLRDPDMDSSGLTNRVNEFVTRFLKQHPKMDVAWWAQGTTGDPDCPELRVAIVSTAEHGHNLPLSDLTDLNLSLADELAQNVVRDVICRPFDKSHAHVAKSWLGMGDERTPNGNGRGQTPASKVRRPD